MLRLRSFFFAIGWILFLGACASAPTPSLSSPNGKTVPHVPTRDEILGPNRARGSVKAKSIKDYVYRNVASAFPDNGKNMLLKDRALSKNSVTGVIDHSPWHLRIYQNQDHIKENQARFSSVNKAFYATALTQREAAILAQAPKKYLEQPFYQMETSGQDDIFEPNNDLQHAFDLTSSEDRWLALLGPQGGPSEGVQWDEDWYKISVSPLYRRLMLDLRMQHYLGDIDMRLYDSKGHLVAASQGSGDDEFIHLVLEQGGIYYVQIYGSNRGNRYDFKYSTFYTGGGDDEYEENDTLKTATDLRSSENRWLSEIRGEGVAADDDYYLIHVPAGRERLLVDLRYDVDKGDIDIRLLNSKQQVIASSANIGDDDFIDFTVPAPGNYYLKVYPFAPQGFYNMYDLKWSAQKPSQK